MRPTHQMFRHFATSWFGFLGRLTPEAQSSGLFDAQVEAFEHFMREERELSEVTILSRCQRAGHFLRSLSSRIRFVRQITVADIDRYLIRQSGRGWSRRSLAVLAANLRSFFRYAEGQHWCKAGLAAAIASPRIDADEGLPRGPDWEEVQRLIASTISRITIGCSDLSEAPDFLVVSPSTPLRTSTASSGIVFCAKALRCACCPRSRALDTARSCSATIGQSRASSGGFS